MAQKRMFSREVTESDAFLELSMQAQCLYLHLLVSGVDDEGMIGAAKRITRAVGANSAQLNELVEHGFLIPFPSGVYAAVHFHVHNTLKSDRTHPTIFQDERKQLELSENETYVLKDEIKTEPERNQNGNMTEPGWNQIGTKQEPERKQSGPEIILGNSIIGIGESQERGGAGGGNRNAEAELLFIMAQKAGIASEVKAAIDEHGFDSAYNAFNAWKQSGGDYITYLKGA